MLSSHQRLHDSDFYLWAKEQVKALETACRTGTTSELDLEHIIEEIDELRIGLAREVKSFVILIVRQLLSLQQFPSSDSCRKWMREIQTFRRQVLRVVKDNPSSVSLIRDESFFPLQWEEGCADFADHFYTSKQMQRRIKLQLFPIPLWTLDEVLGFDHLSSAKALPSPQNFEMSLPDTLYDHLLEQNPDLALTQRFSEAGY